MRNFLTTVLCYTLAGVWLSLTLLTPDMFPVGLFLTVVTAALFAAIEAIS
jgi:hypothetical protein